MIQEDDDYLSSKEAETLLKEYLSSEEIVNIIHDYQSKEIASMCICNGDEKSNDMIKCDNTKCKARWFHLKCVGLDPFSIPQGVWQCHKCSLWYDFFLYLSQRVNYIIFWWRRKYCHSLSIYLYLISKLHALMIRR